VTRRAFDKIAAGLNDAIAYQAGESARARIATVDAKIVRQTTGMTQSVFARAYRLPIGTVRDWEQARRTPDSGSAVYLQMIAADPEGVRDILAKTV
jgi:putative transcriptional regulator